MTALGSQLIASFLYRLTWQDPLTIGGALALLALVSALAAFVPALRAAQLDPVVALRWE